ncbi:N-hydroxyarylamine O-acetyltransferase [Oceanihabitans sediminis]|uniref:Arylamine N-acetyltransferase n=1 Tax=Oceanihabitans sediminis TaxID=1812012 RepID=A0A368P4F7_9FLAO|nr:arylamine N-acetyltransferase [Oceanihabitans sediminis]MDX1774658.1 arylamine N-acetyltransferase [Oceanihabitans sediminis]RBP28461.1 N-hydroxyarylamine O-acetyltransferase [Oceanihabitans sediminis]RCU56659.1 arylamine N-acetyltransferase [Oceanihabitans sediminis]
MSDFIFNKQEYLRRINLEAPISVNYESLKALHRAQHLSIPFENIDICLGKNIPIDAHSIFQKLVKHKRGGYCFELNGLLLLALQAYGFEVRPLLGRVHLTGEPGGRTHQALLVTIDSQTWLVDVGFGAESPTIPIPFVINEVVRFEHRSFRLVSSELFGYMLQSNQGDTWKNLYSFDLSPVLDIDLKLGNHFTSTSPDSFFINARIAALPVPYGVLTLYNDRFKKVINGKEEQIFLKDDASYLSFLAEAFDIHLEANYKDLKAIPFNSAM